MKKIFFISAIDTDAGKTVVTGLMGRFLREKGVNVITQKLVQTGCEGIAEDILVHRKIMKLPLLEEDCSGVTNPLIFHYPASPHLAAALEKKEIDVAPLDAATKKLQEQFEVVLIEGAGGLHVPLNDDLNIIDYLEERKWPLILVTSSKLGSINHTLLSLEVCRNRGIEVAGLVYNHFPNKSTFITKDSIRVFQRYLSQWFPNAWLAEVPVMDGESPEVSFDALLSMCKQ